MKFSNDGLCGKCCCDFFVAPVCHKDKLAATLSNNSMLHWLWQLILLNFKLSDWMLKHTLRVIVKIYLKVFMQAARTKYYPTQMFMFCSNDWSRRVSCWVKSQKKLHLCESHSVVCRKSERSAEWTRDVWNNSIALTLTSICLAGILFSCSPF